MDQTRIWDFFQNDEAGEAVFNARPRYEFLAGQIADGQRVLDIGVGRGGLESILTRRKIQLAALDPGERSIQMVRDRFGLGDNAKVGWSQDMPFPDSDFDVVVVCELIEHLTDEVLGATLAEAARVLKPGGRLIGTTPADENLSDSLVVCPHCGERFHRWGHVQTFTTERLRSLLTEQFIDVRVSRHFFGEVRGMNWKGRLLWGLKKVLVLLGVRGVNETFGFSGTRA